MTGSWWAKLAIIVGCFLLALYALLPTFLGEDTHAKLSAQAASVNDGPPRPAAEGADEDDLAWWEALLPDTAIKKGIDLAGGIDLTLQVEVDEAVLSSVQRDARPMGESLENEGIHVEEVRRMRGEAGLLVHLSDEEDLTELRVFMQKRYNGYTYEGTRELDGFEYHLFMLSDESADYIRHRAVEQALETLRDRVNETGVKEPTIVQKGGNRINVQLPGMDDTQEAIAAIGTTAVLEFMMVDEEVSSEAIERMLQAAQKEMDKSSFADDRTLSDWLIRAGKMASNDRLIWEYKADVAGKDQRSRALVVRDEIVLTGDDVNDAHVSMNQYNEPYVHLEFKPRGGRIFSEITGANVGKRFAIVLDQKMRSAPVIREKIAGGQASIEMGGGGYNEQLMDAQVLSLVLRTGALPAPVTIGEVRVVGATLGADAIRSGLEASVLGGAIVLLFMLVYYRTAGFVADLALAGNVVLIMALLAAFGATLTLPGIAGVALTIGMAVDANIIIYERIREELRLGKTTRAAVDAGFSKALSAVLDANITTFIAGVVLFSYGTGAHQGLRGDLDDRHRHHPLHGRVRVPVHAGPADPQVRHPAGDLGRSHAVHPQRHEHQLRRIPALLRRGQRHPGDGEHRAVHLHRAELGHRLHRRIRDPHQVRTARGHRRRAHGHGESGAARRSGAGHRRPRGRRIRHPCTERSLWLGRGARAGQGSPRVNLRPHLARRGALRRGGGRAYDHRVQR
ncbi:MAG: protein translocase subunit SecD [Pseudomonadota bacterium]